MEAFRKTSELSLRIMRKGCLKSFFRRLHLKRHIGGRSIAWNDCRSFILSIRLSSRLPPLRSFPSVRSYSRLNDDTTIARSTCSLIRSSLNNTRNSCVRKPQFPFLVLPRLANYFHAWKEKVAGWIISPSMDRDPMCSSGTILVDSVPETAAVG